MEYYIRKGKNFDYIRKGKDFANLCISLIPNSSKSKLRGLCVSMGWRRTQYRGFKLRIPKHETDEDYSLHCKELRLYFNNRLYYIYYSYFTRTA